MDISTTCCIRAMSLVNRVISEEVPKWSRSKKDNRWIFPNNAVRKSVPNPIEVREAIQTFTILKTRPNNEINTI